MSKVVPALISKSPSEVAIIFSSPTVSRAFFGFDTSAVTTCTSAKIFIYQNGTWVAGAGDIIDYFAKNADVSKKDANVIAAASNKELKNKGVTNLPTNKKKTYKQAWGSMTAVMKKKYKNFKDFENHAIAWNKRKQNLKA